MVYSTYLNIARGNLGPGSGIISFMYQEGLNKKRNNRFHSDIFIEITTPVPFETVVTYFVTQVPANCYMFQFFELVFMFVQVRGPYCFLLVTFVGVLQHSASISIVHYSVSYHY